MKKTKLHLHPLAAAIAFASGSIALPQIAVAQEGAREEEEVLVVSARRRDESLQEVPISLSSFSGDALEKQGIQDITQVAQSSPNTTMSVSRGSNTTITAFIRGIGQQDPVAGFEAGVGIYIDDVYLNRPQGAVVDVYDVERIEILRGPQGTLYGRNTIGGAIKYVTKRLSDEPELSVKGTLGEYNQTDLLVSGSTPLGDVAKIGGSLAVFKRDGFGENKTTGEENYDKDIVAGRVSFELTPTDELYVRLAADYTEDNSNTKYGRRISAPTGTPLDDDDLQDRYDSIGNITEINHPINENYVEASGVSAFVEYQINDALTFKSTTAYREDTSESPIDFDSIPGQAFDVPVIYENEQLSQEFQLAFEFDRVAGSAGFYYLDANAFNAFDVILAGAGISIFTIGDVDTSTWAVFSDVSFDVTDTLEITLGARYTEDERTSRVFNQRYLLSVPVLDANGDPVLDGDGNPTTRPSSVQGSPYFGGEGAPLFATELVDGEEVRPNWSGSRTDDAFTPKISVSWKPSDDANLYASYSQGFKGGGFDPRGDYRNAETREGFKPETVDAYEIGLKSNAYDGQILSNLAFFYSDFTNVQIPSSLPEFDANGDISGFVGATTNAGKAEITGVEWDVTVNFTDSLSAVFTAGLIQADYVEYELAVEQTAIEEDVDILGDGSVVQDVEYGTGVFELENVERDRVFQNTPEQTASLTLNYGIPVGPGELTVTGSASYRSSIYINENINTYQDFVQGGYTLYNVSAVWNSDDDHWQGGLHIQNLTDQEYIVAGYDFTSFSTAFYGNPRQIFGTVKYSFF